MSLTNTPVKLRVNGSWLDFHNVLHSRQPFNAGAMRYGHGTLHGEALPNPGSIGYGQLHASDRALLMDHEQGDGVEYIAYSYATPIAWKPVGGMWVVPDARYSVTTSKHQGRIRTAISQLDD